MTANTIEAITESRMDRLDREYTRGQLSDKAYDAQAKAIEHWAQRQYQRHTKSY